MHKLELVTPAGKTDIEVGEGLTSGLGTLGKRTVLLADSEVRRHHGHLFDHFPVVTIPSGEQHKHMQTVESIYRQLIDLEIDRSWFLVGIGGGLATDVAGFVASTFLRGIPFGFISTTLLGQVDASIGGKNGVNLDRYKNMIGVFRQPEFVWCDLSLLSSLNPREYVSGIAEVIKYGAIRDLSILDYLEEQMEGLLGQVPAILERIVTESAQAKVEVVTLDELESGLRMILNFGHTFGHAIEREKGYLHGEAIGIGMVLEARLSQLKGLIQPSEVERIMKLVERAGLPVEAELDAGAIMENIRKDKKRSGSSIQFVWLDGLGHARVEPVSLEELQRLWDDLC